MARPRGRDFNFPEILARRQEGIEVPEYQRDYDWKRKTFNKLVTDLIDHALEVENQLNEPYFLGNMIIQKNEDEGSVYLVDGQQRTTALMLLVCAVRDKMIAHEQFRMAENLHNNLVIGNNGNFRYSPKPDSDTKHFLGYYQSFPDINSEIVFTESINEDGMHAPRVEDFTPQRTIPERTEYTIEGIATIRMGQTVECVSTNQIFVHVELEEDSAIEIGETITIGSQERTTYQDNHGMDFRRILSKHYNKAFNFVQNYLDDYEGPEGQYFQRLYNMLTNISFTTTEFTSVDEAIYYFEVLNDDSNRLSLSAGDLWRARLETLRRNNNYSLEHRTLWKTKFDIIQSNLKKDGSYDHISEFMWTWLLSRGKRVSKRKTWSFFGELINDQKGGDYITGLMNTLAKESILFREIYSPKPIDPEFGGLFALSGSYKQHHPLLLNVYASYKNFDDDENTEYKQPLRRITRIFSYLILRGFILPNLEDKIASNRLYAEVERQCKNVWQWPDENIGDWTNYITTGQPNRERVVQFIDSFSIWVSQMVDGKPFIKENNRPEEVIYENEWSQNDCKLVLSYVEWYMRGFHEDPTWNSGLEVEHILPKSPTKFTEEEDGEGFKYWGEFSEAQHEESVNLLGNRVLLPDGANKKLNNYSFITKRNMNQHGYVARSASWKLVWLISEYDEWRIIDINQFGELYSELIIHIFGNPTFVSNEIQIEPYNDYIETLQEFVDIEIERLPVDEEE